MRTTCAIHTNIHEHNQHITWWTIRPPKTKATTVFRIASKALCPPPCDLLVLFLLKEDRTLRTPAYFQARCPGKASASAANPEEPRTAAATQRPNQRHLRNNRDGARGPRHGTEVEHTSTRRSFDKHHPKTRRNGTGCSGYAKIDGSIENGISMYVTIPVPWMVRGLVDFHTNIHMPMPLGDSSM